MTTPVLIHAVAHGRAHALPGSRESAADQHTKLLAIAISTILLSALPNVHAGNLSNGARATVGPSTPVQDWTVTGGSILTISAGGATGTIAVDGAGSSVVAQGGTISKSVPTIAEDPAILLSSGATADITDTRIVSVGNGINLRSNAASSLRLVNSDIAATRAGIQGNNGATIALDGSRIFADGSSGSGVLDGVGLASITATSTLANGSYVGGQQNGAWLTYAPGASGQTDASITLDASTLEGMTGAALRIQANALPLNGLVSIVNGSTLIGGNGNIIEVLTAVRGTPGLSNATVRVDDSRLDGDVSVAAGETLDLRLANAAQITGRLDNVTAAVLQTGSRWNVTADSTVGTLTLDAGTLAFDASAPGFKTVTVGGDFTINGGTVIFNSVLGDDASPSDKLVLGGNASGTGTVVVNNLGGSGAQTGEGIELISVAGASNATFALSGRAVGGAYEYFLFKGGVSTPSDGGWYLRSALPVTPDPCVVDPSLPQCKPVDPVDPVDPVTPVDPVDPVDPVPVLRPEPGAYLANQAAAIRMFQQRRHDRGEPSFDRDTVGAWARVSRDQLHTTVAGQVDARSQTSALQIGSDLARWGQQGRGSVGVMLATGDATTQASSRLTGYGTRGKVEGDALGVYASWVQNAEGDAGLYLDGWLQYGRYDSQVQGDGLDRERYHATTRAASLEAGYGIALTDSEHRSVYLQPQVQVSYTDYNGDLHRENNGTRVEDGRAGGLESRVGVRLFGHDNAAGNRVQPFVAVNWLYTERGQSMRFDGQTINASLPTNRYEAQAGAQLRLGERWSAWGDLRVQRGDGGYRDAGAQIGVRRAW